MLIVALKPLLTKRFRADVTNNNNTLDFLMLYIRHGSAAQNPNKRASTCVGLHGACSRPPDDDGSILPSAGYCGVKSIGGVCQ